MSRPARGQKKKVSLHFISALVLVCNARLFKMIRGTRYKREPASDEIIITKQMYVHQSPEAVTLMGLSYSAICQSV